MSKNSPISLLIFSFLLSLFLFSFISAQARKNDAVDEKTIVSNEHHLISYKLQGDNVIFTMESIKDFRNDLKGEYPDTDFFSMHVDLNRNGKIDKDVDLSYGVVAKTTEICTQYLRSPNSSSVCGEFKSAASVKVYFEPSGHQRKAHPIFVFIIPKAELNQGGNKADLVFTCFKSGDGVTIYPYMPEIDYRKVFRSLSKTITIDL